MEIVQTAQHALATHDSDVSISIALRRRSRNSIGRLSHRGGSAHRDTPAFGMLPMLVHRFADHLQPGAKVTRLDPHRLVQLHLKGRQELEPQQQVHAVFAQRIHRPARASNSAYLDIAGSTASAEASISRRGSKIDPQSPPTLLRVARPARRGSGGLLLVVHLSRTLPIPISGSKDDSKILLYLMSR